MSSRTMSSLRGFGVQRRVASLVLCAFVWTAVGAATGRAADDPQITSAPRKLVEDTVNDVVGILAQRELSDEERISRIEQIAYEVFDFTTMSKLVLARNWKKLDEEQRAEFVREFKQHLSRIYGERLNRYEQEQVDVYAAQIEPRGDVSVKTRIVGGQFDDAEISYRLRHRKERWRAIDVVIEGVSLVSNYRSQFAEVLNRGTIDDLMAKLRDKNFTGDEEGA